MKQSASLATTFGSVRRHLVPKVILSIGHRCQGVVAAMLLATVVSVSGCASGPNAVDATQRKANEARYAKAKSLFEERCKTAGAIIKRTVKDVEGIELINIRPVIPWGGKEYLDPLFAGAAMAAETQGDSYIAGFLYSELRNPHTPKLRGVIQPPSTRPGPNQNAPLHGYRFVDARDPSDGQLWRYQITPGLSSEDLRKKGGWAKDLERAPSRGIAARYAVDYVDIVDPTDRSYWIAGTRISVLDRQTGEVVAELTRYVWDSGFGASTTGRWPWQHVSSQGVNVRPSSPLQNFETRYFVDSVLLPKQGD